MGFFKNSTTTHPHNWFAFLKKKKKEKKKN